MSDILTTLAALTAKDENGLLSCPSCNAAVQFRKALHISDGNTDAIIHKEPTNCGLIEFGNGTTDESILTVWNTRPREAALIALVQEAAGEIETLRKLIPIAYRRGWDKAAYGGLCGDAWNSEDDLKQAINPQEAS